MPSSNLPLQATFVLWSALGAYLTWGLLIQNGTQLLMQQLLNQGPQLLPGTDAPLKRHYTGNKAIDYQLTVLTVFFWEIVHGSMPAASLHAVRFASQIPVIWGLLMIEGMRAGNEGKVISWMVFWGFFVQCVDYAITMPIYLAIYLAISPTVSPIEAAIVADIKEVYSVPISLFLGYLIPAIGAALPAPSIQTFEAKQNWLAVWQGFPLWVSTFQQVAKRLLGIVWPASNSCSTSERRDALRSIYSVLFYASVITHLGCLIVSLSSMALPDIFGAENKGALNFSSVLLPAAITSSLKVQNIGAGALLLLQYDEIVGSTAMLLWASFMRSQVVESQTTRITWLKMALKVVLMTILTGPGGCMVLLMRQRDERVFKQKVN